MAANYYSRSADGSTGFGLRLPRFGPAGCDLELEGCMGGGLKQSSWGELHTWRVPVEQVEQKLVDINCW